MVKGVATVWLPVSDMKRAVAFYGDVLGLEVAKSGPEWSEVDANGLKVGLNAREDTAASAAGGAVITFQPESGSLETEIDQLSALGVEFTGGISEHPWGRLASFRDSEGNDLQLYTPPAD